MAGEELKVFTTPTPFNTLMWWITVMGNLGDEYEREEKSWIPQGDRQIMAGMDHA
jgi:hypothetical protein